VSILQAFLVVVGVLIVVYVVDRVLDNIFEN
jgi:hypothetical protein